MHIRLRHADYEAMIAHARQQAPVEDCGLIGGTVQDGIKTIEKVFYLTMVVAALVLAVGLLYVKTKTLEVQGNTMDLRSKISQETTRKTEYDQQILDLTSGTKVLDTANKADLKQNPSNVLKATK